MLKIKILEKSFTFGLKLNNTQNEEKFTTI